MSGVVGNPEDRVFLNEARIPKTYLRGYAHFKGQVLNADDADCLFQGLKLNNIDGQFSHLLTGKPLDSS